MTDRVLCKMQSGEQNTLAPGNTRNSPPPQHGRATGVAVTSQKIYHCYPRLSRTTCRRPRQHGGGDVSLPWPARSPCTVPGNRPVLAIPAHVDRIGSIIAITTPSWLMAGRRLPCAAMRYGGCGLKPWLIKLLKFGISAAIITWLVIDARGDATFATLVEQPKHWGLLAAAFAFCFTSIVITFLRWYYLVRALGIPFTLLDAFRLGFVGYMFNFVSLGNVGGDLFKAIFLAREHKERRAEAVASVMADRIIGLYALFLLATAVMFGFGRFNAPNEEMNVICRATLVGTLVGTFGLALLLWPHFTEGKFAAALRRLPRVGPTADKLLGACAFTVASPVCWLARW